MIYIASDHGGFYHKQFLLQHLPKSIDLGCFSPDSVDYPLIADQLCQKITDNDIGIILCGTGIGVSIQCNRYNHIRCGLCHDNYTAQMAKEHNNANVIALGARVLTAEDCLAIIQTFLHTDASNEPRHVRRRQLLSNCDNKSN